MIRKREADRIPLNPSEDDVFRFVCKARKIYSSAGYDILNIDISKGGEVVARYFADPVTEEYKGHLVGQPWKQIKLKNIIQLAAGERPRLTYDGWNTPWDTKEAHWVWDEESGEKVARAALHGDVDWWENSVASRQYYDRERRRWQRVQDRINEFMLPTPKGFEEWSFGMHGGEAAVEVLCVPGAYEYQCTKCTGKWIRKKRRYRPGRQVTCPNCGAQLTVSGHATHVENFYIFSACGDGTERWYERFIHSTRVWNIRESKWEHYLCDQCLAVLDRGERFGKCYYREGQGYSESRHNGQLPTFAKGYIYPDFGGAEEYMSSQQARCLRVLADQRINANANKWIMAGESKGLEYLLKGRYYRLATYIVDGYGENEGSLVGRDHMAADNLQDYLGLDGQRCLRLRQINGGVIEFNWLRYEQRIGKKVSADDLRFFSKNGIDPNDTYYGTRGMLARIKSPAAFRHYLEKQSGILEMTVRQTIDTYADYIRMAKAQGLNLDSEIFYKPKDLKAAHDECVRVAHERAQEEKAAEAEKKYPGVSEVLRDIRDKYTYEGEEYMIIVPERIMDILLEGRALGHCVDTSDRYFERIRKHVTYIVFLRKRENPKQSWYTLEIEPGGTVRQQRTTGNRQNKEDVAAYMPFIREWQQVVRSRISDEDREAAERSREIRLEEYRELREKKETVRNGLLAGKLLVDVLEADLVEAM